MKNSNRELTATLKANHAFMLGNSFSNFTSISASTLHGIVSNANKSTPPSIRAFIRLICHAFIISGETVLAYDPVYSEPSCNDAP